MTTVLIATAAFPVVIVLLTLFIVTAERKLVRKGAVKITINGDEAKALDASRGKSLLATLSGNGIFLASACGGKGTCGTCR